MKLIPISLCPGCLSHEVASWLTEKSGMINAEAIASIYLELRDIKLKNGSCIVCKNNKISQDCFYKIYKVLEKNKIREDIRQEFALMFGMSAK